MQFLSTRKPHTPSKCLTDLKTTRGSCRGKESSEGPCHQVLLVGIPRRSSSSSLPPPGSTSPQRPAQATRARPPPRARARPAGAEGARGGRERESVGRTRRASRALEDFGRDDGCSWMTLSRWISPRVIGCLLLTQPSTSPGTYRLVVESAHSPSWHITSVAVAPLFLGLLLLLQLYKENKGARELQAGTVSFSSPSNVPPSPPRPQHGGTGLAAPPSAATGFVLILGLGLGVVARATPMVTQIHQLRPRGSSKFFTCSKDEKRK